MSLVYPLLVSALRFSWLGMLRVTCDSDDLLAFTILQGRYWIVAATFVSFVIVDVTSSLIYYWVGEVDTSKDKSQEVRWGKRRLPMVFMLLGWAVASYEYVSTYYSPTKAIEG